MRHRLERVLLGANCSVRLSSRCTSRNMLMGGLYPYLNAAHAFALIAEGVYLAEVFGIP
jgi:hypothetical protein